MDYEGNAVYYYVRDALGSVTALVDKRGKVVKRYFYSPYGKLRGFPGWGERMMGMMGKRGRRSTANPLTYTGREYDSSTGLYYYRARYYNPGVGRFISVDPLMRQFARSYAGSSALSGGSGGCGSCGGLGRGSVPEMSSSPSISIKWRHPYGYVRNNPVNYVDPEGLRLFYLHILTKGYTTPEEGVPPFIYGSREMGWHYNIDDPTGYKKSSLNWYIFFGVEFIGRVPCPPPIKYEIKQEWYIVYGLPGSIYPTKVWLPDSLSPQVRKNSIVITIDNPGIQYLNPSRIPASIYYKFRTWIEEIGTGEKSNIMEWEILVDIGRNRELRYEYRGP